ncbi:MAG TPA: hypothetical protein VF243_02605, partial [Nitrosospira sp.]
PIKRAQARIVRAIAVVNQRESQGIVRVAQAREKAVLPKQKAVPLKQRAAAPGMPQLPGMFHQEKRQIGNLLGAVLPVQEGARGLVLLVPAVPVEEVEEEDVAAVADAPISP